MKGGNQMKLDNSVKITLIIVAGILILGLIGLSVFNSLMPGETVRVNGQATVQAVPDLVTVYFNVETEADTTEEARDANSEIVEQLKYNIIALGFEQKDIITQNYNINENCKWENRQQVCDGFVARHSIKVEMPSDSDKTGKVIDAGVNAGAQISYINFELSPEKQQEYKAQAIKLAAEDAKLKADSLAEGLDQKVGKLVSVSMDNFYYSPWNLYDGRLVESDVAMAKEAVTNIQPGERDISSSVQAVFKIS